MGIEKHTQDRLRERLIARLEDESTDRQSSTRFLRALTSLGLSLDEFSLWQGPDVAARLVAERPWLCRELVHRFEGAAEATDELPRSGVHERLSPFVSRPCEFPPELARAALQAMLKLEATELPPLRDADWQQQS